MEGKEKEKDVSGVRSEEEKRFEQRSDPETGAIETKIRRKRKTEEEPFRLAILDESESKVEPEDKIKDKKSKKDKKPEQKDDSLEKLIKSLLYGISNIAESKSKIWKLEESEINMVAEPASRIMGKYVSAKAEGYSDLILLISALLIITIPRILQSLPKKGEVKNDRETKKVHPRSNDTHRSITDGYQTLDTVNAQQLY